MHDRDGLVAARLPVGDERLGARLALLRRAFGGQLDDLRRQDALGGRAPAHAGAGLDPVGVAEQRLLVPGAALYIGRVALVLALAEDVGEPVAGRLSAAHFHAAETGVECAHDLRQAVVSGDPPDAVILDACQQGRGLHVRLQVAVNAGRFQVSVYVVAQIREIISSFIWATTYTDT